MARIYIDTDELADLSGELGRLSAQVGDARVDLLRAMRQTWLIPPKGPELSTRHDWEQARLGGVATRIKGTSRALAREAGLRDEGGWRGRLREGGSGSGPSWLGFS
ncbi:MAG: hypothetical protein ACT452_21310 [Microthrixaceae bacterium]